VLEQAGESLLHPSGGIPFHRLGGTLLTGFQIPFKSVNQDASINIEQPTADPSSKVALWFQPPLQASNKTGTVHCDRHDLGDRPARFVMTRPSGPSSSSNLEHCALNFDMSIRATS
jgi:hypothetical protein